MAGTLHDDVNTLLPSNGIWRQIDDYILAIYNHKYQAPLLLAWIKFDFRINKETHAHNIMGWNYLSVPKFSRAWINNFNAYL